MTNLYYLNKLFTVDTGEKLFSVKECKDNYLSKGDIGKSVYPDLTFDYALPQQWLDNVSKGDKDNYEVLRFGTVYAYPDNYLFGVAAPLTIEAKNLLDRLVQAGDMTITDCGKYYL